MFHFKNKEHTAPKGDKRIFKYGGFSVAITAIVIAAVIILNVLASTLETQNGLKIDLTANDAYTLSVNSQAVLNELDKDVVIYAFLPTAGTAEYATMINNLVDIYGANKHITVKKIDPRVNPTQMSRFNTDTKTLAEYSVVIMDANNQSRFYTVNYTEMTQFDSESYKSSFVLQQKITSAINNIRNNLVQTVYLLSGHGEPLDTDDAKVMINRVEMDGYTVEKLDLATSTVKLTEGDIVLVLDPTGDLTNEEKTTLLNFLEKAHGRMLFVANRLVNDQGKPLTNFEAVLDYFHISIGSGVVAETDTSYMASKAPVDMVVLADKDHDITASVRSSGNSTIISEATTYQYAYNTGVTNDTIQETWAPILTSSPSAVVIPWEQYDVNYEKAIAGKTIGAQTVGAAFTKVDTSVSGSEINTTTKIVLFGSDDLLLGDNASKHLGNSNIFRNTMTWLAGRAKTDEIVITGVDLTSAFVYMNQTAKNIWFTILVAAFPGLVLICGMIVWVRRKNL